LGVFGVIRTDDGQIKFVSLPVLYVRRHRFAFRHQVAFKGPPRHQLPAVQDVMIEDFVMSDLSRLGEPVGEVVGIRLPAAEEDFGRPQPIRDALSPRSTQLDFQGVDAFPCPVKTVHQRAQVALGRVSHGRVRGGQHMLSARTGRGKPLGRHGLGVRHPCGYDRCVVPRSRHFFDGWARRHPAAGQCGH